MSRSYKTEGVVLKRKNFGEADRLLTIYSKHYGKIRVIAKGVRRTTSRKAGSLELFSYTRLVLAKGKNLDLITEVELINSYRPISAGSKKNLLQVGVAYYFCELVDKLTPEAQANKLVFSLLKEYLGRIKTSNLKVLVRCFEESLLNELGFGVPREWQKWFGSLQPYIETIVEKEIVTPQIVRKALA